MAQKATKRSVEKLQKFFEFLGSKGGMIKTNDPDTWWDLSLEILDDNRRDKDVSIGIFKSINGDVCFDPCFDMKARFNRKGVIQEAYLTSYESTTLLGRLIIDEDDNSCFYYNCGLGGTSVEKDEYGLRNRFDAFMNNMDNSCYLENPKWVKNY